MKLGRKGLMKPIVAKAHITILVVAWASCHQGISRRGWESACEINKSILALLMLVFDGKKPELSPPCVQVDRPGSQPSEFLTLRRKSCK